MRIVAITADGSDGCSWYRATGPFAALQKRHPKVDVRFNDNPSWGELRAAEVAFFLRPCTNPQLALLRIAKDLGVKVWVDYDDDLFHVPSDNPSATFYADARVRSNMAEAIRSADIVSVTTNQLKNFLLSVGGGSAEKYVVVPNCYDQLWDRYREEGPQQNLVLWRGTGTHSRDLFSVSDQLERLFEKYPGVTWAFVGPNPWIVIEGVKNAVSIDSVKPITTYFKTIMAMRPRLVIAPLAENLFNLSKSPIAALEALACGAPCIARAWPQWSDLPSVIPYYTEELFSDAVDKGLAMSDDARKEMVESSFDYIRSHSLGDPGEWRSVVLEKIL